jgi:hypothetical protein
MSKAERLLSYSLLSLITTKPIATLPNASVMTREEDTYSQSDLEEVATNEEDKPAKKSKGHVNEQGAWCWREGCEGSFVIFFICSYTLHSQRAVCLKLTRALQKTSETLQSVADLYDDHVRYHLLHHCHEILKSLVGTPRLARSTCAQAMLPHRTLHLCRLPPQSSPRPSGISLFITTNICESIVWKAFPLSPSTPGAAPNLTVPSSLCSNFWKGALTPLHRPPHRHQTPGLSHVRCSSPPKRR